MLVTTVSAGDMTFNFEGTSYVLHEDNTWDFLDRDAPELKEDLIATLPDNRTIKLLGNHSWQFLTKDELKQNSNLSISVVKVQGRGTHSGYSEAVNIATKKALANATQKIRSSLPQKKLNQKKLENCVRRVEKESNQSDAFTKGKGWSVTIDWVLDKGSILAVLDCESIKDSTQTVK